MHLTAFTRASRRGLYGNRILVAGTDAVGTCQGLCNGDITACDMQASGQCSKQQRCQ